VIIWLLSLGDWFIVEILVLSKIKTIAILGDGAWGTTLAIHLVKKKYSVRLWGPFPEYLREIQKSRDNTKFLPGIEIPPQVILTEQLEETLKDTQLVVLAIPSQYVRSILNQLKAFDFSSKTILSTVKGIETESLMRISQLIYKELGKVSLAVLSGPTIAREVALGIPTTAVVASPNPKLAQKLQNVFHSDTFRIYTNRDMVGAELGGSVKNIIAIACGVCDGLGFGTNAKAAILTRGLAEMARFGVALGAKSQTFTGLTGLGDLVTTCFSPQSRNRSVGEQLGKGKSIDEITSQMSMVAEGVSTVKAVYRLSRKRKVPMPITTEVFNVIYKNKNPQKAVRDLMKRRVKAE